MRRAATILAAASLAGVLAGFGAGLQDGMGTARLSGEVRDEAGRPLPGVKIALVHVESGQTRATASNEKGKWNILGLGSGIWRITLTLDGYRMRIEEALVSQFDRNGPVVSVLRQTPTEGPGADTGVGLVEEGNRLFDDKNYDEALLVYRRFLDKHSRRFQVHFNIGNCFKEKGDYDSALREYGLVLDGVRQTNPEMTGSALAAKALAAIGEVALRRGDPAAARESFEKALALYPRYANLPYGIGEIYASNGMLEEALSHYEMAARVKPDWPDPWLKLGFAHLKKNDVDNAVGALKRYLELAPDASQANEVRTLLESLIKK